LILTHDGIYIAFFSELLAGVFGMVRKDHSDFKFFRVSRAELIKFAWQELGAIVWLEGHFIDPLVESKKTPERISGIFLDFDLVSGH